MPRCPKCCNSVMSYELDYLNNSEEIGCSNCRNPKEDKMDAKKLFSINVFEIQNSKGQKDHEVVVEGNIRGIDLKLGVTMDQVRDYFSHKAEAKPEKQCHLKSVEE